MSPTALLTLQAVVRYLSNHPDVWRNSHLGKQVLHCRPKGVSPGAALEAVREALGVTGQGTLAEWGHGKTVDVVVRELRAVLKGEKP